jgi:hypothetical protein
VKVGPGGGPRGRGLQDAGENTEAEGPHSASGRESAPLAATGIDVDEADDPTDALWTAPGVGHPSCPRASARGASRPWPVPILPSSALGSAGGPRPRLGRLLDSRARLSATRRLSGGTRVRPYHVTGPWRLVQTRMPPRPLEGHPNLRAFPIAAEPTQRLINDRPLLVSWWLLGMSARRPLAPRTPRYLHYLWARQTKTTQTLLFNIIIIVYNTC